MKNNKITTKEELNQVANELLKDVEGNSTNESTSSGTTASYNKSISDLEQRHYQPTISKREIAALKRARYDKIQNKFRYGFVIQNMKNGLVVEIRATSAFHACNIIGWRPKNTRVIEIIDNEKNEEGKESATVEVKVEETNTAKVESNA
jgi:hypothetical protein